MRNQHRLHQLNSCVTNKIDSSRSVNQLSNKKPLLLPNIKKKRNFIYDNISVSPDHIRISNMEKQEQKNSKERKGKYATNSPSIPYVRTIPTMPKNCKITLQRNSSPNYQSQRQGHVNQQKRQYTTNSSVRYLEHFDRILKSGIFDEDRVIQKQNQYDQQYKKMKNRLKWKAQQRKLQKGGLSMIYDRFINLL